MERKEFTQGTVIKEKGQPVEGLLLILEGTVKGEYAGGEILLKKGAVVGLGEVETEFHFMTYRAAEKVTAVVYPYPPGGWMTLLREQPEAVNYFVSSACYQFQEIWKQYKKQKTDSLYLYRFFTKNYKRYEEMCEKYRISPRMLSGQEAILPPVMEEDRKPWLGGYYKGICELVEKKEKSVRLEAEFYCGMLMKIGESLRHIAAMNQIMSEYRKQILEMLMNEKGIDLFDLFTGAYFRIYYLADSEKPDRALLEEMLHLLRGFGYEEQAFFRRREEDYRNQWEQADMGQREAGATRLSPQKKADLNNSLDIILAYAGCMPEEAEECRRELSAYKQTVNKSSAEEEDRKRRVVLTGLFYRIYMAAIQVSLKEKEIPTVIKMFFLFGYMDEELAGEESASYLYDIAGHVPSDPDRGVYTVYEWLRAIYEGKKEPCRNEFDSDYNDYVHELKRSGKITPSQETAMLADRAQKVMFELEQVFPVINKVTYGRITTFCPIFSEHHVVRPLEKMLVSADGVHQILEQIRKKDFGAFCRETILSLPEKGIVKEYINLEILPDIILTPNIGNRGMMWQEIEGKRRSTPARFMCSLFQEEDIGDVLIKLTGEYRWEMCKRIQGARWNDVSERSLTSEYSEYLQSYRKNTELSVEIKEKIKTDLGRHRNNAKEMFVADYMIWILYESGGSPRLNKVVRAILFTYCPFAKEVRERLRTNPLYADVLDKYEIRLSQKTRMMDRLYQKYRNSGTEIPKEIIATRLLLES